LRGNKRTISIVLLGIFLFLATAWQPVDAAVTSTLKVHFINVGQVDSILVQQDSYAMLIDGGNNADGPAVKKYLQQQKINKLSYVVGTHAHEYHIGGLDYVINSFKVGRYISQSKQAQHRLSKTLLMQ
jgi:competence protein ComEC